MPKIDELKWYLYSFVQLHCMYPYQIHQIKEDRYVPKVQNTHFLFNE